jgi:RNA polymerase sigma-70 factor, ECF subfamily
VTRCDTTPMHTDQAPSGTSSALHADAGDTSFAHTLALGRRRDPEAVSWLYRRFLPIIYRFLYARVGDTQTAEDLTSDTFFAVMEGIDGVRAEDELGFATWALGIARNKLAMHFRRLKMRREIPIDFSEATEPATTAEEGDPLAILSARERWTDVVAALNLLTPEQRETLWRRCLLGQSAEEIAQSMGKPTNAIYGLQFRALAALARRLREGEQAHEEGSREQKRDERMVERRSGHGARSEA